MSRQKSEQENPSNGGGASAGGGEAKSGATYFYSLSLSYPIGDIQELCSHYQKKDEIRIRLNNLVQYAKTSKAQRMDNLDDAIKYTEQARRMPPAYWIIFETNDQEEIKQVYQTLYATSGEWNYAIHSSERKYDELFSPLVDRHAQNPPRCVPLLINEFHNTSIASLDLQNSHLVINSESIKNKVKHDKVSAQIDGFITTKQNEIAAKKNIFQGAIAGLWNGMKGVTPQDKIAAANALKAYLLDQDFSQLKIHAKALTRDSLSGVAKQALTPKQVEELKEAAAVQKKMKPKKQNQAVYSGGGGEKYVEMLGYAERFGQGAVAVGANVVPAAEASANGAIAMSDASAAQSKPCTHVDAYQLLANAPHAPTGALPEGVRTSTAESGSRLAAPNNTAEEPKSSCSASPLML